MAAVKKGLLFIVTGFVLLFGFKLAAQAEESAAGTEPKYVIYVNRTENCITIMEQQPDGTETVVKVMACSCGIQGHRTPEGTFYTSDYYNWRLLVDGSYGRYAVRFNNRILFHSVPYTKKSPDALEWDQYNLLGENASLGCVRLAVEDVKWIFDNCKPGTRVTVYSGEEIVGGVTRPDSLKIAEDSPNRGWDPTDRTPGNPWFGSDGGTLPQTGTLKTFNYTAYADRYEDVRRAFGYDQKALYNHYITYGIYEGRVAEFNSGKGASSQTGTLKTFNYTAYADRYEDVKAAFGYDKKALYNHYITYGINEGRIAEFNSGKGASSQTGTLKTFNYTAYADRYEDVKAAFGYDKKALYNHYITYGIKEGRIAEFN